MYAGKVVRRLRAGMVADNTNPSGSHGLKSHLDDTFQHQPHVLHSQATPTTSDQKLGRVLAHVLDEEGPCTDLVSGERQLTGGLHLPQCAVRTAFRRFHTRVSTSTQPRQMH